MYRVCICIWRGMVCNDKETRMSFRSVSLCMRILYIHTTREYPFEYVYMFAVFMQNVKILLTAVKCLSCVKLLLCMICILSLLQAHTIPLYITLSYPALKIQRTNAKTHYMICMHACMQMVRLSRSRLLLHPPSYYNSHHSFGFFSL